MGLTCTRTKKTCLRAQPLDGPYTWREQVPCHPASRRGERRLRGASHLTGWPQLTKLRYSDSFFSEQSSEVGMVPPTLGTGMPWRLGPPVAESQERMAHS